MKKIILAILTVLSFILSFIFGIWTVVSFILYLVKDISFNWFVFWGTIAFIIFGYGFFILLAIFKVKEAQDIHEASIKTPGIKKSKFMSRLDNAMEEIEKQKRNK